MENESNWKHHAEAAVTDIDAAITGDEIYILQHLNDARKNIELAIDVAEETKA